MRFVKFFPVLFLLLCIVIFFKSFLFQGLLPIPSDTIVGIYYPFRDFYAKNYPQGIPFKNFLITDPVRQLYPWKYLSIQMEKQIKLPLWNPYSFSGTPLLANFQSGVFYPLNVIFLLFPFPFAWSLGIILQPLLAGLFLYWYLREIKVSRGGSLLGSMTFSFCGISTAWLEWNSITQTILWLPLLLLFIEKIYTKSKMLLWNFIFLLVLISAFLAGHLQDFFYIYLLCFIYFLARLVQYKKKKKALFLFIILNVLFLAVTSIQWIPTLQFILLSSRTLDQAVWQQPGWFIPWQHLVQFIAPDFFGNPSTLNYFGTWNYGELVGFVGIFPLICALTAIFYLRRKKVYFFSTVILLSLIFSLPTPIAKLPFILHIPLLQTAQPTRLLFVIDFSLSILAAFGFDVVIKNTKKIIPAIVTIFVIFIALWIFVLLKIHSDIHYLVSKQNLIFPTILLICIFLMTIGGLNLYKTALFKNKKYVYLLLTTCYLLLSFFDLYRFGQKFTPFTSISYLYPTTQTLSFLQKNIGNYRFMTTDSRIFPPNFSILYKLQSVDGYDPLYLENYAELIAASERNKPNITPPFGFNRIITPHSYDSKIINLLGVKYILSLTDIQNNQLTKIYQEGQTRIYQNKNVLPRAFFVKSIVSVKNKQEAINKLFDNNFMPQTQAIVAKLDFSSLPLEIGKAIITKYSENEITIQTATPNNPKKASFLVFTDIFYPTWTATIDGNPTPIIATDFAFRGIFVPPGKHTIRFYDHLFIVRS